MLVIEPATALLRRFEQLPEIVAVGLLVLALGGAADVSVHVLHAPFLGVDGVDWSESVAHSLVATGIALVVGGFALVMLRAPTRPTARLHERSRRDTD
jgi:hypothetical protein